MYIQNIICDSRTLKVPELFNASSYGSDDLKKQLKTAEDYDTNPFPLDPVYWPIGAATPSLSYYRGHGAISMVHGGGDGLMLKLNTRTPYPSIVDSGAVSGDTAVLPSANSVLSGLQPRNFYSYIAPNVTAPNLFTNNTTAEYEKLVKGGEMVKGVVFRVLAVALEHALVPFVSRTRVRNAAACYWSTSKFKGDNQAFCLQHQPILNQWQRPVSTTQNEYEPRYVVWVGDATLRNGMSLLSRIMDAGGVMYNDRAYILEQFTPGSLLMCGTGTLTTDLQPIQAHNIQLAVTEALTILTRYNCIDKNFIPHALRLLIRNLPLVDRGFYTERDPIFWNLSTNNFAQPELNADQRRDLIAHVLDRVGIEAVNASGLNDDMVCGIFSDIARRQILAPQAGLADHAPAINSIVVGGVAAFVASIFRPADQALGQEPVNYCRLDPLAPPVLPPGLPPVRREQCNDVLGVLSGRCPARLFALSPPGVNGAVPLMMPGFVIVPPNLVAQLPIVDGLDNGVWQEWIGGVNADNVGLALPLNLRSYIVRHWTPVIEGQLPEHFPVPANRLRDFDIPGNTPLVPRANGVPLNFEGTAPRCWRFMEDVDTAQTPLHILTEDGMRDYAQWTIAQRAVAVSVGVAYLWECAHMHRTMNDAFGRWMRQERDGVQLTTVPDELLLYTGSVRSIKHLHGCGGMWVLCFLPDVKGGSFEDGDNSVYSILNVPEMLASYILKLRCAVEVSDQMARMSEARLSGGSTRPLYDPTIISRLEDSWTYDHTITDAGTYLTRQAIFTHLLFDHADSHTLKTLDLIACSGMHLKSPDRPDAFGLDGLRYLGWVTPQTLSLQSWTWHLGFSAPTFYLDRDGRKRMGDVKYNSQWVNFDKENFLPGIMMHVQDELWCSLLTSTFGDAWDVQSLSISALGTNNDVYVGDLLRNVSNRYSRLVCRLNLPHETCLSAFSVPVIPVEQMQYPRLRANINDGVPIRRSIAIGGEYTRLGDFAFNPVEPGADHFFIDTRRTSFGVRGFRREAIDYEAVSHGWVPVEKRPGLFFLKPANVQGTASPCMCPGAARVVAKLQPGEIPEENRAGGGPPTGDANLNRDMPNPANVQTADKAPVSNLPMVELNVSGGDLMSTLSSLSGDDLIAYMDAFRKKQEAASVATTSATSSTDSPSLV